MKFKMSEEFPTASLDLTIKFLIKLQPRLLVCLNQKKIRSAGYFWATFGKNRCSFPDECKDWGRERGERKELSLAELVTGFCHHLYVLFCEQSVL